MDEYEFEHFIADMWEKQGWETKVTTGSGDRGIDVVATQSEPVEQKHLIQAKRYSGGNTISSTEVQRYSSLRQQEDNVDAVIIVTTSRFSRQAREIAEDLNVKLIDGAEFSDLIKRNGWESSIKEYINIPNTTTEVETTTTDKSETKTDNIEVDKKDRRVSRSQIKKNPKKE
jgi:restriction endonuclease Mrr